MIVFILLKLLLFSGILFIFGWQLVRFILSEKRIEALIPLAAIIGSSAYLFLLNFLSYFVDIRINFYLLLVVFIFLSYFLYRVNKRKGKTEWGINKKWRIILFATCFLIMVSVGITGIRFVSLDETGSDHLPIAVTIAEGNFPVRDFSVPNFPSQYHHGFNLLSAAIYKITDLPIWFSYDFQHFILIGILFLLGFLLIKDICQDNFKAYFASLIMIFGGSLNFLYGIGGLSSLYQKYILHLPIEAPFKFLHDMIFGKEVLGRFVMGYSQIAWITLGFALTITVIYLYFRAINDEKNWFKISIFASIMFSFLALSAELFFGVLCIAFFIYPLILRNRLCFKVSFLILFLGFIISFFQGGIITQTVKQIIFAQSSLVNYSFSITPEYLFKGLMLEDNGFLSFFSLTFFLRWGWSLIFIVPTAIYLLKKYFKPGLFFLLLIFISFFLPLVVITGVLQYDFIRLNYLTTLFWNLIFGLFLGWTLLFFKKKWSRLLIIVLILSVIFQGLFYSVLFPIFPNLKKDQSFFSGYLKKPNSIELEAFGWIKKNTFIEDYFLTFEEELQPNYHNSKFVIFTGRLAPDYYYGMSLKYPNLRKGLTSSQEMISYKNILKECESSDLKILNYHYLYINEYWPDGLAEKCLTNNDLELKFEAGEGNNSVRIYMIKK